jgi:hypothetical protein
MAMAGAGADAANKGAGAVKQLSEATRGAKQGAAA